MGNVDVFFHCAKKKGFENLQSIGGVLNGFRSEKYKELEEFASLGGCRAVRMSRCRHSGTLQTLTPFSRFKAGFS